MCYIVLFWHTLFLIFWRLSKVINKGLWQILQLFHSQTYHTACALALTQIEARQTHTIVDTTLVSSHDISYHGDSWHIVNIYHSWFVHNFCHKLSEIRAQCTTRQKKALTFVRPRRVWEQSLFLCFSLTAETVQNCRCLPRNTKQCHPYLVTNQKLTTKLRPTNQSQQFYGNTKMRIKCGIKEHWVVGQTVLSCSIIQSYSIQGTAYCSKFYWNLRRCWIQAKNCINCQTKYI